LQSLLAYFCLNPDRPIPKQRLAYQLWPDTTDSQARTNLRKLLYRMRRAWDGFDAFIEELDGDLYWRGGISIWLDTAEFVAAADQAAKGGNPPERRALLEKAVSLYQGGLLPECYDDWIQPHREHLQLRFVNCLDELIELLEEAGEYQAAITYGERLQSYDPLHEPVYRALMRLYALSNNRAKSLQVYQLCKTTLQRELGVDPSPATSQLHDRLLRTEGADPWQKRTLQDKIPLIGRQPEWKRLESAWNATLDGPRLLLIQGEAGIGKTRLAEELLKWAGLHGIFVQVARCYATEGAMAYAPVTAWLRSDAIRHSLNRLAPAQLREVTRLLPELLAQHADIEPPVPLTNSWQRQQLFDSLAQAILGEREMSLLMLDDLQWCDGETLNWLHYLLHHVPNRRLLVASTLREEALPAAEGLPGFLNQLRAEGMLDEIGLQGMSPQETAILGSWVLNREVDRDLSSRLFSETEGNPLFIVEVARAWLAHTESLPAKIKGVIEARLSQLSSTAGEVAALAACIGREFDMNVLLRASDLSEDLLVSCLDELWERHMIREHDGDTYDFSHDKIREVAYARISPARRRFNHRRIAEAILEATQEQALLAGGQALEEKCAQIATHFEGAGSLYQAFQFFTRAADHAAQIYAHREAYQLYGRAIEIARKLNWPGPELAKLYAAEGRMLEHSGKFSEAIGVYQALEKLAADRDDRLMQCIALVRQVTCYVEPSEAHNLERADAILEPALALARQIGDHEQEAQLRWCQMVKATHYGNPQEALQAGEACISVARQHGLSELLALALHDLALNLRLTGSLEKGTAYAGEARRLFEEQGNLSLFVDNLNQQALSDYLQLDFEATLAHAEKAASISRRIDNPWNIAYSTWLQGMVWEARGEWGKSQDLLSESMSQGQEAGFLMSLTTVRLIFGAILREIGQIGLAIKIHREALEFSQSRAPFMLQGAAAQLALDCFANGEIDGGEGWLRQAQEQEAPGAIGTAFGFPFLAQASAEWAGMRGGWETALPAVQEAIRQSRQRRLAIYELELAYELGRGYLGLGLFQPSRESLLKALAQAQANQLHPLEWRIHLALWELYNREGQTAKAESEREACRQECQFLLDHLHSDEQKASFSNLKSVRAVLG
jgi:DNA-binding SARP family transcriptional activator